MPKEEEFRRKMYALAIPTTDFARGLGCGRSLDNARAETKAEIREGSSLLLLEIDAQRRDEFTFCARPMQRRRVAADISGINFFERKNSFPFFLFLSRFYLVKSDARNCSASIGHGFTWSV